MLPVLTSEVTDSVLRLGTKPRTTVRTRNPIRYRVTLPNLTSISLSGSGSVSAENLQVNALQVDISGSGTIDLAGSADEQDGGHVRVWTVRRRWAPEPIGDPGDLG